MSGKQWVVVMLSAIVAGCITALGGIVIVLSDGKMLTETQWVFAGATGLLTALKDIQVRFAEPPRQEH